MSISSMLFGKKGKMEQLPTMTPEQQQLLSQLLQGLGGPMGMGLENIMGILSGDPEALEAFQAPAMRQFEEQIVPGIAERFTGMGGGAQQSSAFQQALGGAGASLAERLSAQKAGLQSGAMGQLSQLLGLGMGAKPFGYQYTPGSQGFFGAMAPGMGGGIGMGLSSLLGGLF